MDRDDQDRQTYFIDQESAAEMARLLHQDDLVTGENPLPEQSQETIQHIKSVLDVACGPGGWALKLSRLATDIQLPMRITGIDKSHRMIEYANHLDDKPANLQFYEMEIDQLSEFEDESFDLINMRFISGFMVRDAWMPLIRQCKSLLRPGGILRLTESDVAITNNIAQTECANYIIKGMYITGRGFNSHTTMGIVNMLPNFLRDADFRDVRIHPVALDISHGQPLSQATLQDFDISLSLLEPFLVKSNIISSQEFHALLERMRAGWNQDYTGVWVLLTTWGMK